MELRNKARCSGALIHNSRCILTENRTQIMNVKTANHSEKDFLEGKKWIFYFLFLKIDHKNRKCKVEF
jgi:agmatine/peptidylarginine deiminase